MAADPAHPGDPARSRSRPHRGGRERFRLRVARWISVILADRGDSELDPHVLAHALVACAEHFGRTALTDPDRFDPLHLVGQVQLLLQAIWPAR